MAIDPSRVLTITASEYAAAHGKAVGDYDLIGLHERILVTDGTSRKSASSRFAESVPQGIDAVVGFSATSVSDDGVALYMASGTGLRPRRAPRKALTRVH